jgi:hypothetical protein
MFAILLSDKMDPFYQNITSFPTLFFSFFLILSAFYWLLAVLGVVDLDFLDIDMPEADVNTPDGFSGASLLGGLLFRFGLSSVPLPVVVTLISLIGWMICYYAVHLVLGYELADVWRYLLGLPVLIVSLVVATLLTSVAIRPLKPFFQAANQQVEKNIIGQVGVVRTVRVDSGFGEALVEDGGAGLIVKVRPCHDEQFKRGDRVVLLEYIESEHVYRVISEQEFHQ